MSALSAVRPELHRFAGLHAGTLLGLAWREPIDCPPAPVVILPAPAIIRPSPRIIDETRALALALHRERLAGWDRLLVQELIRWRREPSLFEADEVAALAERAFWQARDGAADHPGARQ